MKEKITYIEYNGKQYPLIFTLNVMELIQDEYETLEKWMELTKQDEPNIKALKFGLGEMINEGIEVANELNNTENPLVNNKTIGRLITALGMTKVAGAITENVIASTKIGESQKNE